MPVTRGIFSGVDIAAVQQGIVLAVCGKNFACFADFLHCLTHLFVTLYTASIIRKTADITGNFFISRKLLPVFANRDRAVGNDLYTGILTNCVKLSGKIFGTIRYGIQVRHGADSNIATFCGGICAAFDALLIKKSRFSQMHMNINETRKQILTG